MNIELSIDRIVLDGLAVATSDGAAIGAAVQSELTRLLRIGGLAPEVANGGATSRVDAPGIRMPSEGQPATLGREIARAVYGGIGGGPGG